MVTFTALYWSDKLLITNPVDSYNYGVSDKDIPLFKAKSDKEIITNPVNTNINGPS